MLQLLGDSIPQTPCRGFASGAHWGTVSPRPSDSFCSAPHIFPKFTPMGSDANASCDNRRHALLIN